MQTTTSKDFYDMTKGIMGEQFDRWVIVGVRPDENQRCIVSNMGSNCPKHFKEMARRAMKWAEGEYDSDTLG